MKNIRLIFQAKSVMPGRNMEDWIEESAGKIKEGKSRAWMSESAVVSDVGCQGTHNNWGIIDRCCFEAHTAGKLS